MSKDFVNQRVGSDRGTFEGVYAAPEPGAVPWEIGRPQQAFSAIAEQVVGPVLDAGCGTGENALMLAKRGLRVVGVDFAEAAIQRAKAKAAERHVENVEFLVKDATTLGEWANAPGFEPFATVIDSGLFHVFDDGDRARYVSGLARITRSGARLYLMCFSDAEPGEYGPRRISQQDLRTAFADGWEVESIIPAQIEANPQLKDAPFSPGGPKAWFATIQRS